MSTRLFFALTLVLLAPFCCLGLRGEPPASAPPKDRGDGIKPRTDSLGDPLPEGALARLGTVRFRNSGEVTALAFSPDGRLLLAGGGQGDHSVCLWDATTGIRRLQLPAKDLCMAVTFSPDGKRFAAGIGLFGGPAGKGVCVWETATGKELHRLDTGYDVIGLAFSPDGRTLLVNGPRGALLWEPERKAKRALEGQPGYGNAAAYSPDGKVVATGSTLRDDRDFRKTQYLVHLWDAGSGRLLHTLRGHEDSLRALRFSGDSKLLASGGWGEHNSVRLWDVATGKELPALPERQGDSYAFFFAPDGRSLWVAGSKKRLRAWELPSGKALTVPKLESPGSWTEAAAFSADGKRLAMGSWVGSAGISNAVRVWDLTTGRPQLNVPGHQGTVTALAFTPDGRRLASGGRDGALLWDVAERRVLRRLDDSTIRTTALAVSPDGALIAAGVERGKDAVVAWEADSGKERFRTSLISAREAPEVEQLLFSDDSRRLAALTRFAVFTWDFSAPGRLPGEPRRLERPRQDGQPRAIGLFGAGGMLTVAYGASASRWDATSGKELTHTGKFVDLDKVLGRWARPALLSPDGRLLAVASTSGTLALWELATGEEVLRLQRGGDSASSVLSLAFDPTSRVLAVGRGDGGIGLWDCGSGKELGRRVGHVGLVRALAFAPDGRVLASGGNDTTVLLWDVAGLARKKLGKPLSPKELEERWRLLAGADAVVAHRSAAELRVDPERVVPFLGERLKAPAGQRDIERLIAALDAEAFADRERAFAELKRLGMAAEPALERMLEKNPSAEAKRRIQELLDALPHRLQGVLAGEAVRTVRALGVLEQAGTPEAKRLLRELSREGRTRQVCQEAEAALKRVARTAP